MIKTKKNFLFLLLILFSTYCALVIGKGWDEGHLLKQGQIAFNYLFSLGRIEEDLFRREFYSPIYYSIKYLFIQIFPLKYHLEASHLINMIFSFGVIIGIKKLTKEFFNEKISIITFLILFFYPIFNGHMGFNSKDTIVALCHVWIFYLCIQYIKNQYDKEKSNNYIIYIAILSATGTGINFFFLGSLIPVFLLIIIDIFYLKKLSSNNFNKKKLFIDLLKCFFIFYFLIILFWIDTHENILVLPFNFFKEWLIGDLWRGYPYILLNGDYFIYKEIPKSYLILNLFFKSPEYFLFTYIAFIFIYFNSKKFFIKRFSLFNYKIIIIISMIIYPFILLFLTPFSIYDGLRHVLWMLPYTCVIPALVIYFLIENIKYLKSKITFTFISCLIIYFLFNFFLLTPYQYTYLNLFNGSVENRYKKFENDYWGSSIKELVNKIDLNKNINFNIATCGIPQDVIKDYLAKAGYSKTVFGNEKNSNYMIMTNRVTLDEQNIYKSENLTNCFDKYKGEDVFKVTRNGVVLSVVRKIN